MPPPSAWDAAIAAVFLFFLQASLVPAFQLNPRPALQTTHRNRGEYTRQYNSGGPQIPFLNQIGQLDARTLERISDAAFDTFEDAYLHFRREFESPKDRKLRLLQMDLNRKKKRRIVVLGFGWAGHAISKIIDTDNTEVIFVSPRNYFLFTPMLASSAVGTVEYRSITEPVRKANPAAEYYEGTCIDVFPESQEILVQSSTSQKSGRSETVRIPYDALVWAVGTQTGTFGVPGVREHAFFLKEIEDSTALRAAIVDTLELASLPGLPEEEVKKLLTFAVVGAGPTGVEFTGELLDFIKNDLPNYYPRLVGKIQVKLIQGGDSILPVFDKALREKGMTTLLENNANLEILLSTQVKEVKANTLVFSDFKSNSKNTLSFGGQKTLDYGVCVWAAGTEPRPITRSLLSKLPNQDEKRGKVATDQWLRVKGTNGTIFALGDCSYIDGAPLPETGQVAAQQGAFIARQLNRNYDMSQDKPKFIRDKSGSTFGEELSDYIRLRGNIEAKPFTFLNLGLLAYIGDRKALVQVQTGDVTWSKSDGEVGFLLWRSIYIVKQVSTRNRILVLFDRLKSRLFGRDITRL